MLGVQYIPLVLKPVWRHRTRSGLTIAGVAIAMFLFSSVRSMQAGVERATRVTAQDTTLVVYRENRYCPFTSQLPQFYQRRIEAIEITVGDTATIYGDIYHHILSVDPNAVLDGLRPWRPRAHLAERRPWYPGE